MWTPPDDPNPSEILDSAFDDTRDGTHERALAKFLWFHENALQHQPSLSAVRLSFALGDWFELAAVFPPAKDAFLRTRDKAESAFLDDPSNFHLFQEAAALNRCLGDGIRTADLFAHIAQKDHAAAQRVYRVAERYLVAAGRYDACEPFLESQRRLALAAKVYCVSKRHEELEPPSPIPAPKLARKHYIENVATLVALLVLNDRAEDAKEAYDEALGVLDDDEFRAIMDAAMTSHLPERRVG